MCWIFRRIPLTSLVLILLILSLTPALGARAQDEGPIYIVQEGDTLTGIAQRFGTTVEALVSANGIADPSILIPGTPLTIPGFAGVSGVLVTRSVELGETLRSLSLRYGVAEDVLVRLNRIIHPGRVFVGQELIIPEDAGSPSALRHASVTMVAPGESRLEAAVRAGLDPWVMQFYNHNQDRLWVVPAELLALPAEEDALRGLPPSVRSAEVSPLPAVQGQAEVIRLNLASPAAAEGSLGPWTLHFFPVDDQTLVALQGIHAMAEPGFYDIDLRFSIPDVSGGEFRISQPIQVMAGGYPNDPPLSVPPQTIDPAVTGEEDRRVASVVAPVGPDRLWEGAFQFPVSNYEAFPSRFGSRRSYNDSGYFYYHAGLDFYYTSADDTIRAPARGIVVYAGLLTVRGNTTFIDHGWGVYTGYLHQSEILVAPGDLVEVGQVIGRVGDTGRVTGPHLHWEIWVGGVPVNPLEWVETPLP
jgi:murein DD-endopeptidase MepM/ murein hydrolase activator NlpD